MGRLVFHDLGRLVMLAACTYALWAAFWGVLYRKFFWDMIGGTLGPNGIIPGANAAPFVAIIVKVPVVQSIIIANSVIGLALEWPLPFLARLSFWRIPLVRAAFAIYCGFWASLVYQSVDSAAYFAIAAGLYVRSHYLGELLPNPSRTFTKLDSA